MWVIKLDGDMAAIGSSIVIFAAGAVFSTLRLVVDLRRDTK